LGAESLSHLRKLAGGVGGLGAPDSTGKRSLYIAKNITLVLLKIYQCFFISQGIGYFNPFFYFRDE